MTKARKMENKGNGSLSESETMESGMNSGNQKDGQNENADNLPEEAIDARNSSEEKDRVNLENYIEEIADTVRIGLDQSIAILTPWFFNNMPKIYYQTTPRSEKVRHLSAIITGHVFETKQTVELWDRNKTKVTYIGPGSDRRILADMAHKLLPHKLKMGSLYFSRDNLLFLSTFSCCDQVPLDQSNYRITDKMDAAKKLITKEFPGRAELQKIDHYLNNLDNDFVIYANPVRILITYRIVRHMLNHEGIHTTLEHIPNSRLARLVMGVKNMAPSEILENVLHLMHRYDFNVTRAFLLHITENYPQKITVLHFIIKHEKSDAIAADLLPVKRLTKALRTIGWVDFDDFSIFLKDPYRYSINAVNLLRSLSTWIHVLLGKQNPYYFAEYKIGMSFRNNKILTEKIIDLFRLKFDPLQAEDRSQGNYDALKNEILIDIAKLMDEVEISIFKESVNFIDNILITNYFLNTKTGLAFRIDPNVLNSKYYPQKPFGIFFIVGRNYRFFHIRWKDISRGGLRVVMPRTDSDYSFSLAGLFDEVYGLSYAQQLKNKDIPEGGSKAVLLLKPGGDKSQAVRGSVNAMLDLLVSDDESHEETRDQRVSYYPQDEIIYLGPDENMTPDLIRWVPEQAKRRGYKYFNAFMSSKPEFGINHKEFGVTSEGVNVFLRNVLHYLGIDPLKEKFTVKITGGPDGDVAGNLLKILHREYGENARIVAIADGFGCSRDDNGLDWTELLRLVKHEESIVSFAPEKLSDDDAFVIKADSVENIKLRNELHFEVDADIFVPAGGRPYTVNAKNWERFIVNGKPTMKAIVEGANIFFTPDSREFLDKRGVVIIKDSSANKTGVICSSYEILASLILSNEEFAEIKNIYVDQVIALLQEKADLEAKLIFHEKKQGHDSSLVSLSMDISKEINSVTDMLLEGLTRNQDEILANPKFTDLILKHCPPILVEKYRERVLSHLPKVHKIAILSAYIASTIVYKEGLGWINQIPPSERFKGILTYIVKDQFAKELVDAVLHSDIEHKDEVVKILNRSATRDLTILELTDLS